MTSPPPYPSPGAFYPQPPQPYPAYSPGTYPAGQPGYAGYPPYGHSGYHSHAAPVPPGYVYGPGHTVYMMEDRRRNDTGLSTCLQACLAALCCCCLWDMMTPDCH